MHAVEALFNDARHANEAKDALQNTRIGSAVREMVTVDSPAAYDRLALLRHTQALLGALLGAAVVLLPVALVLVVLAAIAMVDLTAAIVGVVLGVATAYGAIVGLAAGLQAPSPSAVHMRRGLQAGQRVVHVEFEESDDAAFARSFLASHPGARSAVAL